MNTSITTSITSTTAKRGEKRQKEKKGKEMHRTKAINHLEIQHWPSDLWE